MTATRFFAQSRSMVATPATARAACWAARLRKMSFREDRDGHQEQGHREEEVDDLRLDAGVELQRSGTGTQDADEEAAGMVPIGLARASSAMVMPSKPSPALKPDS